MMHSDYHIILASNSPRRKELLSGLDIPYEVFTLPDIPENYPDTMDKEKVSEYLSLQKAKAYQYILKDDTLLITADTIVLLGEIILEKPKDAEDAKRMLRMLSGKTHKVITGVSITTKEKQKTFSDTALVTFENLTDEEIEYYVQKYKPFDKAGAYGVQEWIGYVAVKWIEGSYFNVMGLPIHRVYQSLKAFGVQMI